MSKIENSVQKLKRELREEKIANMNNLKIQNENEEKDND